MLLSQPSPTRYDLRFSIGGIPVRVHPFFWLVAVLLGAGGEISPVELVIWVGVLFVSLMVHELGHAVSARYYGGHSSIVLYSLGGLANPGHFRRTRWSEILIILAGPCAGFLLAGLMIAGLYLSNQKLSFYFLRYEFNFGRGKEMINENAIFMTYSLLRFNIFWGLVNLLPVFPLDGGQIARELFLRFDHREGLKKSLWLSVFTAVGLALFGFTEMKSTFMGIMFLLLAFESYQLLQGGPRRSPW